MGSEQGWRGIESAPRDGTRFHGLCEQDAISMLWHDGFKAFVSSWRRMEFHNGWRYADTGLPYQDHSPVEHQPTHWKPLDLPASSEAGDD